MEVFINLHDILAGTKVLGPGNRIAIWLQGCHRNCRGCMSPYSRPMDGGHKVPLYKLTDQILKMADTKEFDGITISGGEPFLQVEALYELLKFIKENTEFGVIIYTGYQIEELRQFEDSRVKVMLDEYVDILIDGEFVEELNDGRSLVGSSNQKVHFLTNRYENEKSIYESTERKIETYVRSNEIFMVGIPNSTFLENWNKSLNGAD